MKNILLLIIVLLIGLSCEPDKGIQSKGVIIEIKEFKHIEEKYDYSSDSYSYSYGKGSLDSIEISVLSEILQRHGIKYYISDDKKLFYKKSQIVSIGGEFVLDRELVDSIIEKKLPRSNFVKELAAKFDIPPLNSE